jgi:hypothetical protein
MAGGERVTEAQDKPHEAMAKYRAWLLGQGAEWVGGGDPEGYHYAMDSSGRMSWRLWQPGDGWPCRSICG